MAADRLDALLHRWLERPFDVIMFAASDPNRVARDTVQLLALVAQEIRQLRRDLARQGAEAEREQEIAKAIVPPGGDR